MTMNFPPTTRVPRENSSAEKHRVGQHGQKDKCRAIEKLKFPDNLISRLLILSLLLLSSSCVPNDNNSARGVAEYSEDDDVAPSSRGRMQLASENSQSPKEKSAFASVLGTVLEVAVGTVGGIAQSQLNSSPSSSSPSYSSGTTAMRQQATVSDQTPNSSYSGSANLGTSNQDSTQNASRSTQTSSQQDTSMLGPAQLGAATNFVTVAFNASTYVTGTGIIHSDYAKKKGSTFGYVTARGTIQGYDYKGQLHTESFEAMFPSKGPYNNVQAIVLGACDFSRGFKMARIDWVRP